MFEVVFDYGEHDPDTPTPQEDAPWLCRARPVLHLPTRVRGAHLPAVPAGPDVPPLPRRTRRRRELPGPLHRPHLRQRRPATPCAGRPRRPAGHRCWRPSPTAATAATAAATSAGRCRRSSSTTAHRLPRHTSPTSTPTASPASRRARHAAGATGSTWTAKASPACSSSQPGALVLQAQPRRRPASPPPRPCPPRPRRARPRRGRAAAARPHRDRHPRPGRLHRPRAGLLRAHRRRRLGAVPPVHVAAHACDWDDPNLRFLDLDGDGHPDVLLTDTDALTWYPSLATDGFGPAQRGPPASTTTTARGWCSPTPTSRYLIADMSGDGLTDLVRVRNGEVCYWPNLGYGRFGPKIVMDDSPWFDRPDRFDPKRLRLADIDGSGTTDLIYLRPRTSPASGSTSPATPSPTPSTIPDCPADRQPHQRHGHRPARHRHRLPRLVLPAARRQRAQPALRRPARRASSPTCWSGCATTSAPRPTSPTPRRPSSTSPTKPPGSPG